MQISLYIVVDDRIHDAYQLNSENDTIHRWALKWLVTFNPAELESMVFSCKMNKPVIMDTKQINTVSSRRNLD